MPALLGEADGARLLDDIADELAEGAGDALEERLEEVSPAWPATARCAPAGA